MRLQFTRSVYEKAASALTTVSLAGGGLGGGLIVPMRSFGSLALALVAALGMANLSFGQTIATELFSSVLATSVMPNKNAADLNRWDSAIWPDASTSSAQAVNANPIVDQGDVAFAQLVGQRTQLAGRTLIPIGGETVFYSTNSAANTEVVYDSNSAFFAAPTATDVESGYGQGLQTTAENSAAAFSYQGMGNVIASLTALRRESLSAATTAEASYANLTWSPAVTSGKSATGLASFVHAASQENSVAYSGPTAWTSRSSSNASESLGANFAEPATPDFETYLTIGAALAFLGLVVRRSQPEQTT